MKPRHTLVVLASLFALAGGVAAFASSLPTVAVVPSGQLAEAVAETTSLAATSSSSCGLDDFGLIPFAGLELEAMALSVECRACIGDCREDYYWCNWSCSGPACGGCTATFNGCVASCHADVC